jgi:hypothetical protein
LWLALANATTGGLEQTDAPEDIANRLAAGYTTELMVNTGQMVIDATMAAFPNQNVTLSIGSGAGDLDPTSDYLSETIVDYATTTYGRFITEKNSLSATTVDPAIHTPSLWNWQVLFDQCPNVAAQMLWFVSGDPTYRMNGGTPTAIAPLEMVLCITTGFVRPMRLETLLFQMKRVALLP